MSTQMSALWVGMFRDARTHYLSTLANLEAGLDNEPSLAEIVAAAKNGIEYDLAGQAQAFAYLHMLASVEGATSAYFLALSRDLRMEAVTDRPWPKLAAVEAAIDEFDHTEWILEMIETAAAAGEPITF
jgi:hypothetical protein